jgi:hypothetical protein
VADGFQRGKKEEIMTRGQKLRLQQKMKRIREYVRRMHGRECLREHRHCLAVYEALQLIENAMLGINDTETT